MNDTGFNSTDDPYLPLAQSLPRGDAINGWILARPRQRIVELLKGQRVLDVCCGTGTLTAMLVAAGSGVVGVDSSSTMLSFAQGKHIAAEFRQVDAARLPFNGEFDAAVISLALHEMAPDVRDQVWLAMRRAVRPGGTLIALDFVVPQRNTLMARAVRSLVEQDERSFQTIHREHYINYQEFMRNGGLRAFIKGRNAPPESDDNFWAGMLAVITCRRSDA